MIRAYHFIKFKNKKIKINPEFIEISYQEQLKSKADAFVFSIEKI